MSSSLKTYNALKRLEKGFYEVPKSVQMIIPIKCLWQDGIFLLTDREKGLNQYSITYRFSDINYLITSSSDKKKKFLLWENFLNSFESDARYKISVVRRKINKSKLMNTLSVDLQNDDYDVYRKELNDLVIGKATAANGMTQELYITVSTWKKDIETARAYFQRAKQNMETALKKIGSDIEDVDATERLRLLHDFYRPDESDGFFLDLKDMIKRGDDVKDYICPDCYSQDRRSTEHFIMGKKYGRALFLREYARFISDNIVTDLCSLNHPSILSIDLVAIPTDEVVKMGEVAQMNIQSKITKYSKKAAKSSPIVQLPYSYEEQVKETGDFLEDIRNRDQRAFVANISYVHLADSKEELDADTDDILATCRKHSCQLATLYFEQLDGLLTALPYGINRLCAERIVTTESASVFMPFKAQELMHKDGIYIGTNAVTGNVLSVNTDLLANPNSFVFGVPGAGKSFFIKQEISEIFLSTNDDILILDPENEYTPLVKAFNGQVINISASSPQHINAMDMAEGYGEGHNPYADKTEFIISLIEQIDKKRILGGDDKSIIDRCVALTFKQFATTGITPTLVDLRNTLMEQEEEQAHELALSLELFTTGSLDAFAHTTNVDISNRLVCYNIADLGETLKSAGTLVITDAIINRVTENWRIGKRTWIMLDEFHVMLADVFSTAFFCSAWRRFRKRNANPCGITQNPASLLENVEVSSMLGNSTYIVMFRLAEKDAELVGETYNLSEEQLKYVSPSTKPGNGLVKVESDVIPLDNQWKKDSKLYNLMTTKPGEWTVE